MRVLDRRVPGAIGGVVSFRRAVFQGDGAVRIEADSAAKNIER